MYGFELVLLQLISAIRFVYLWIMHPEHGSIFTLVHQHGHRVHCMCHLLAEIKAQPIRPGSRTRASLAVRCPHAIMQVNNNIHRFVRAKSFQTICGWSSGAFERQRSSTLGHQVVGLCSCTHHKAANCPPTAQQQRMQQRACKPGDKVQSAAHHAQLVSK